MFSFQHASLLTVHTDSHGHAFVEVDLCNSTCHGFLDVRNRVKETPLQVGFHFGNKNNQRVLNLANTEGGRAQSLFVGPKSA